MIAARSETLNVGQRGIYRAKTVLENGTPEEIAACDSGEAAVALAETRFGECTMQGLLAAHHGLGEFWAIAKYDAGVSDALMGHSAKLATCGTFLPPATFRRFRVKHRNSHRALAR